MDEERKTSLEKMVATELLKLAMETEEERKARLVATVGRSPPRTMTSNIEHEPEGRTETTVN